MAATSTPEATFDLLADAAGVHHPTPARQNRGLCPAHDDHNNPGLTFTLSDSGNLLVHCFARECSVTDIAASIGVPVTSFFAGSRPTHPVQTGITFSYPSILDAMRLMPVGYSFDEQGEATFDVIHTAILLGDGTYDHDLPYHELPHVTVSLFTHTYLRRHWESIGQPDWKEYEDEALRLIRTLSQNNKTDNVT